jgi:polyphenol oxidase
VFYLSPGGDYRVPELDQFDWLVYGFGTRHFSAPESTATLRQIHSDIVVPARGRTGCLGEGDALLSDGVMVAVKTADCIPIFLVDAKKRAVAAVHAGWRGTARQIARRAVEAMAREFDTCATDLHAAVGPGIGACCYEVGPEVAAEFGLSGIVHLDLLQANRAQLLAAGVVLGRIYGAGLCTMCRPQEFWSFRREKLGAGRMYSYVGIL